ASQMRPRGATRNAHDHAARRGLPVGSAEADERGHEVHTIRGANAAGQALGVARGFNDAKAVAQPLYGRAGHENRAFERVRGLAAPVARNRGEQAASRRSATGARVEQQKGARAIGVLSLTRAPAALSKQCRLLVARHTMYGEAAPEHPGSRRSEQPARWTNLRKQRAGNAEKTAQLRAPAEGADIEEHRAGRVRRIGRVHRAAGQMPDQPAVHGPREQIAARCTRTDARLTKQPLELGGGEVRVHNETRELADQI